MILTLSRWRHSVRQELELLQDWREAYYRRTGTKHTYFGEDRHGTDNLQVVQIVFFGMFVVVASVFNQRMRKQPTQRVAAGDLPWQRHLFALYGGSILILIRSIFRLVEYTQGNGGYLISHEVFLYVFDGVLMFLMMCLFAWYHPSEINALLKGTGGKAMTHAMRMRTIV